MPAHFSGITCCDVLGRGRCLVSGSADSRVIVWHAAEATALHNVAVQEGSVVTCVRVVENVGATTAWPSGTLSDIGFAMKL